MKLINCFGNTAKRNDCCNTAEKEWSRQEQIDYTTEYIQKTFVDKGMCADWSIHDKGDGNSHVHLLVTMRSFNPDHSWGNKEVKDWDFVRDENGNIVVDESHSDWWQDKKNPDRHGIRIPVLDENGNQKVGARNRKQWKRVLTDATGWNNPKNCELWRSEWANVCNAHLKVENHIDHRSYARQGKFEIPTIHEGADARKIDEKFQTDRHPPLHGKWRKTRSCKDLENVGQVEELLLMTEQMQDELDQKDQTILELNKQLSESLTLNEKLNSENRVENIEALRTRLRQTEERLTNETDRRKRADAEVVAWKFKYEKAEQEKLYAQTHQKTVEVAIVMGILFTITGLLIVGIGYQVGKSTGNIAGISSVS